MSSLVVQTLGVTAPVFAMLFLGVVLKRIGWIDSAFIGSASTLVFKGSLPTLLFLSILQADLATALQPALILYFVLATIASFLLAWGWALWRCPQADRGVYVQGAFRGNNGIVGLALASSLYGDYVYAARPKEGDGEALEARQVFVGVGRRSGANVEIVSGLAAGDVVVTAGQNRLSNGTPVAIDNTVDPARAMGQEATAQ